LEKAEYRVIRRCEDRHWWYVGLHDLVMATVHKRLYGRIQPTVLDAGCGTGGLLEKLQQQGGCIIGLDFSGDAFEQLQSRRLSGLVKADVREMPFEPATFDLVTSMDVLCALEGDDIRQTVEQMQQVLKPGGYMILNLPAYSWLYSGHDAYVGNKTRYCRHDLVHLLKSYGFEMEIATYRNTVLFVPAILARLMKFLVSGRDGTYASDVKMPSRALNQIFLGILMLENFMIDLGIRFPFGLSIYLVARKPDLGAYQFTSSISSLHSLYHEKRGSLPCN